jgi:hypothetical protein
MISTVISEWLRDLRGGIQDTTTSKTYVVTLVVVVYQDFVIEGEERKAMIWAETCTRGSKILRTEDDPETVLTEEFWGSEVEGYIDYFTGELSKHKLETLEPRVDPVEEVVQSIKILMHRQTKVDPSLH